MDVLDPDTAPARSWPVARDGSPSTPARLGAGLDDTSALIELFFFAYRDFVGDADRLLEDYGFGRAHHRVLHFVNRRPGMTIAELLDVLAITKQSLARVLKELVGGSFVETRLGEADRRQRRLFATPDGRRLAQRLTRLQAARFGRALADLRSGAGAEAALFLMAMIEPAERGRVAELIRAGVPW